MSAKPSEVLMTVRGLTAQAFKVVLPAMGYEVRPEQFQYAMHIAESIVVAPARKRHADVLMLEAGAGTGKTFGYTIPGCLYAALSEERVGISTHTLALQDQLFGREALYSGRQPDFASGDRSDLSVAIEVTKRLCGKTLLAAFRKGRHSYLSPDRALSEVRDLRAGGAEFVPGNKDRLDALEAWAHHINGLVEDLRGVTAEPGTDEAAGPRWKASADLSKRLIDDPYQGLIAAWAEDHALPIGVFASDICCLSHGEQGENPWYHHHINNVQDAQIVVFSHSLQLLSVMRSFDGESPILPSFGLLVHDECDTMGDVAKSHMRKKFRPSTLANALAEARPALKAALRDKTLAALWSSLESDLESSKHRLDNLLCSAAPTAQSHMSNELFLDPDEPLASEMSDMFRAIQKRSAALFARLNALKKNPGRDNRVRRLWSRLADSNSALTRILCGIAPADGGQMPLVPGHVTTKSDEKHVGFSCSALSWSPNKHIASIELVDLYPGQKYGREWMFPSDTKLVVLTSATMRVPPSGKADEFVFIRTMVGVPKDNIGHAVRPVSFGQIAKIYHVSGFPSPFVRTTDNSSTEDDAADDDNHNSVDYNPQWVAMAVSVLKRVADKTSDGRAVLVHAGSYRDIEQLYPALHDDPRFFLHLRDIRVTDGVEALCTAKARVLVTPALQAGANIRSTSGKQLLTAIVVLRLPVQPRDTVLEAALVRNYSARGFSDPAKRARNNLFSIGENKAIHRFTQEIGRGIRDASDVIDLWVLDPRFPLHPSVGARIEPSFGIGCTCEWTKRWHSALPERFRPLLHDLRVVRVIVPDPGPDGDGVQIVNPSKIAPVVPRFF